MEGLLPSMTLTVRSLAVSLHETLLVRRGSPPAALGVPSCEAANSPPRTRSRESCCLL